MRKLNLGCGADIREGWVNADYPYSCLREGPAPVELVWGEVWPWGQEFDVVLLSYVLNHVPLGEVGGLLRRVREVMVPSGVLVIVDQDVRWYFETGTGHSGLPVCEDDPVVGGLVPHSDSSQWNTYPEWVAHYCRVFFRDIEIPAVGGGGGEEWGPGPAGSFTVLCRDPM